MFERDDNTERFYVEAVGHDAEALKLGFGWLFRYASKNGHGTVGLAVASKRQIEPLQWLLGDQAARALDKDGAVKVNGVVLRVILSRRMPVDFRDGPILAVWTDDHRLEAIDALGAPALCAITWNEGDVDQWRAAWGPVDLRSGEAADATEISNPVVRVALEHLTNGVNLGTGLSHPSDRGSAIGMFRMLVSGGEHFDPEEVRAWATRHGWEPKAATGLAELATAIREGRRLRGEQAWAEDALKRIRAEAAEGSKAEPN